MSLSELITSGRRLAFVGLAKNTGKTETLTCALRELTEAGIGVGVTSIGRDGEQRDVLDMRIDKPRITLPRWSLVATTDRLLHASAVAHELLVQTSMRTPLGRIVIARMLVTGAVEIAGPSAAQDVRRIVDEMLAHGAEQVLIDGAVDRRAACSPAVSDGVVMSTGAVLHEDLETVVERTRRAVALVRLAEVSDRAAIERSLGTLGAPPAATVLLGEDEQEPVVSLPRFALRGGAEEITALLRANPRARHLVVGGALCESFLDALLIGAQGRELQVTVSDSTRVFLSHHHCDWYERQGISIRVLAPIHLRALTINPTAPQSHRFDSEHFCAALQEAIPDLAVFNVRDRAHELAPAA